MKTILSAFVLLISTVVVNAHFQISFPPPRGRFVEDNEPNFCDGYTNVTTNRTQFPLTGGFITLNSEHPQWSAAFYISNSSNPNSFNDFTQVNSFFQVSGEGGFCIPLNFATSNFTGLQNGENVTIQMLFNGGDGNLFQCADVTLTDNNSSISSVSCSNATQSTNSSSGSGSGSGGSGSGALGLASSFDVKLLGFLALVSLVPCFM
ncbi:hypothetical protein NP233_g3816 [Leucocoprinus birnbaumii]|uniref:Copper acquisition factor BIM1-like domain-containing protein n=1 Tax=Leucocoprinus birnbaumii TaxID=56174 RepID=A0AAD5VVT3_9AGAR|nr:hypothetical protein NP233_g3816 [Leucocoprinus birnbaumii]